MKIRKKLLICMLAAVCLLTSAGLPASARTTDITGHWAERQVAEWFGNGLVRGYSDGTFRPDSNIARAEFIALVNRAFGFTEKADVQFSDVPLNAWYRGEIQKAVAAGYITVAKGGAVRPNEPLARVEAAKILAAVLKWDTAGNTEAVQQFKDAGEIPEDGTSALNAAVVNSYIQGSSDGYIQPLNSLSRAEAVTVLYKARGGGVDEKSIPVTAAEQEYKGVIIDKHCFAFGEPDKDTIGCLLMPSCEASGYGIAFKKDNVWKFCQFDKEGHKLAKEILTKTKKESNITILVKGVAEGDTLKVLTISEDTAENAGAAPEEAKVQTFTGYITAEDDFAGGLGADTAGMVYMRMMAQSGLGITFQQNGKWVFYYFDGKIASYPKGGTFNGTGSQLEAWNIVGEAVRSGDASKSVPVTVTGVFNGDTQTNPGEDADGLCIAVITVKSITKN